MTRTLEIFWEHTPDLSEIPLITSDTEKTFCQLLKELGPAFIQDDIFLIFTSRPMPGAIGTQSRVTLNRRPLGCLLVEVADEQRQCEGRRYEMVSSITFPVISHGGIPYQCVPDLIIRKMLIRAVGIT